MNTYSITVLGLIAAVISTVAFFPQVIRSWRTKTTRDISLGSYLLVVSGVFLWLVYGLLINDFPLILANGITLLLTGVILILKLIYK